MVSFTAFVEMTLLACFSDMAALRFLLPLPICSLQVCVPTFFAVALKVFLPQTTSAIFDTDNSNKSGALPFAAGST